MESETSQNSDQCAVCGGDINETDRNTATDSGATNEHESDNTLGESDKTNIRTMTRSDEDKKSSKKVAMKELQKLMAHLFDDINDVTISDEDDKKKTVQKPADKGAETYSQLCRKYKKVPINNVMRQFGRGVISLDGYDLSTRELKAFFVALLDSYVNKDEATLNKKTEGATDPSDQDKEPAIELSQLELGGNKLEAREISYLGDFITEYPPLVSILLNRCRLCHNSVKELASLIRTNKTLRKLDLSENNLTDNESPFIADIIENNEQIKELVLRKNNLGESVTIIGEALVNNDTLLVLDLSWNHIRANGAIGLCKGIALNRGLETLLLAWNGFGYEGCAAMGWALNVNTTLQSLDLTCNRIHPPALFELLKGLEKNKMLSSIKLGHNPITAPMSTIMLTRFLKAKESNLKELDLEGIVVDKEFDNVLKEIQSNRIFLVRYEAALPLTKGPVSQIDPKNIFNIDPIRILYFMKEHLRTIDLFLKFDKDCSNFLSRDEMKYAFEMEGFPISSSALDEVMGYLDINKDGEVDLLRLKTKLLQEVKYMDSLLKGVRFSEFIEGERKLKRQLIKEREDAANAEKEKDHKFSSTFSPGRADPPKTAPGEVSTPRQQRKLPPLKNPKKP